jgi:ABC-type polysaccharide/polyol phosphate transport system ATPase subunit
MAWIKVRNLSLDYPVYGERGSRSIKKAILRGASRGNIAHEAVSDRINVKALNEVSFDIEDGQRVGILGANGSGKTTLLKVLCGIYEPTRGRVVTSGRVHGLLSASLGLDRQSTGRDNIILRGIYLGIKPSEMRKRVDDIVEFSGLGDYIDMPVRTYSAGMTVKLAFSISTCLEPEILVLDEWLGAGDAAFIEQAQRRMESFVRGTRILVLASHSMGLLERWCDRGILLRGGQLVTTGPIKTVTAAYRATVEAQKSAAAGRRPPTGPLPALATWREYNQRGARLAAAGDFHAAIRDFNEAIRLAPPTAILHQRRGKARMAIEDLAGAMADFDAALTIEPDNAGLKELAEEARRRDEGMGVEFAGQGGAP